MMKEMGKNDLNYATFLISIPMYEPLEVSNCKKCAKIIAQPKELIRIRKKKGLGEKI